MVYYVLRGGNMENNEINKIEIGQRINTIRLTKGMTLEEFGKIFGATKGNVLKWEKGQSLPSPERLKTIAKIADISVNNLLYGRTKERIAKILYKLSKENDLYKDIDIKAFTRSIFHALPDIDISNDELEKYIAKDLEDWFSTDHTKQNENTSFSDEIKYIIDFHSKIVQPILKKKLLQYKTEGANDKELEILEKIIETETQFLETLTEYNEKENIISNKSKRSELRAKRRQLHKSNSLNVQNQN